MGHLSDLIKLADGRSLGYSCYRQTTQNIRKEQTMTAKTKLAQKRLTLLQLAEKLGNVSKAC
jgi:hypothetical protein